MTDLVPLDGTEAATLYRLEETIERGLATFVEVGRALIEIRDGRLYRETHGTFEDYCRERWAMSKTHANRLVDAAHVAGALTPIGVTPATESVARELAPVLRQQGEEAVREAWAEITTHTPEPTAAQVREHVRPRLPSPAQADRIARETGIPQIASDGYIHNGRPQADTRFATVYMLAEDIRRSMSDPTEIALPTDIGNWETFDRELRFVNDWLQQLLARWDAEKEALRAVA